MAEFDAIGRDVAAAADSNLDPQAAGAFKALWVWAGFDKDDNPNHLWSISVVGQPDGFTVSASIKDANVYVAPAEPAPEATPEELARQADAAEQPTGETEVAPAAPAAPAVEAAQTAITAVSDTADTPAPAPPDQHVAIIDKAKADVESALAQWPDSPQLQDAKAQLEQIASAGA